MRRTLTILVTSAAFLLPAAAASAAPELEVSGGGNASCSNGKGGNLDRTGSEYSGKGNTARAAERCRDKPVRPRAGDTPVVPGTAVPAPENPGNGLGVAGTPPVGGHNEEPSEAV